MKTKLTAIRSTIEIDKYELKEYNKILKRETASPDYGSDDVIATYTAKFTNGFEADIKVCNGDSPYVDPVLFDKKGNQLVIGEVTDCLDGEYIFEYKDVTYTVIVK